jgi:hypothetical protein
MHLWDRTAAPIPRNKSATGIIRGTAGEVITGDIILQVLWVWQAKVSWDLLHPGHLEAPLFTGSFLCVTLES